MRRSVAPGAPSKRRIKSTQERCAWSERGCAGGIARAVVVVMVKGGADVVIVVTLAGDRAGASSKTALKAPLSKVNRS